jgi:hypothetical protein
VPFLVDKTNRPSAGGPKRAATIIVNFQAFIDIGRMADVKGIVGTGQDINKKPLDELGTGESTEADADMDEALRCASTLTQGIRLAASLLPSCCAPKRSVFSYDACYKRAPFGGLRAGSESNGATGNRTLYKIGSSIG